MRKDRKEKFKKIAVVAGLSAIGVLAVAGICLSLKKEEPQYIAEHLAEPEKTVEPEITAEPVETGIKDSIPEPSATPEIAVSTEVEPERAGDGPEQSIQPDPVRTEEQKPEEPPKEAEDMAGGEKENPLRTVRFRHSRLLSLRRAQGTRLPQGTEGHPRTEPFRMGRYT